MSDTADLERRFGGLQRLYGAAAYARLRGLHVVVVGLGGVGSWAVEALARSGVAALTLIDLDHVAESNINRQVQALSPTLGAHKGEALRARIADIHPDCTVRVIDAFVEPGNWPALLDGAQPDGLIDACDQGAAKLTLAHWALAQGLPAVCCGAAGGKQRPEQLEVDDLARVTHDPLLARLRQRLRRERPPARNGLLGLPCVFSREPVQAPQDCPSTDGSLNCAGYGSSVMVTASMGFTAAARLVQACLDRKNLD